MLVGAILSSPGANAALLEESRRVVPQDFTDPFLRLVWTKVIELRDAGQDVETTTVRSVLQREGQPADVLQRVVMIDEGLPRFSSVRTIADTVIRASASRLVARTLIAYGEQLRDGDDLEATVDRARSAMEAALMRTQVSPLVPISNLIDDVETELDEQMRNRGVIGLRTGLPALDDLMGGMRPGRLYLFGARTSDGKTTMAAQLGITIATEQKRVLLFSLEMDNLTMAERLAVREARREKRDMFAWNPTVGAEAYNALVAGARRLSGRPLLLCDRPGLTLADVRGYCALERMRGGLDLVIVDHAQIVASERVKGDKDRGRYLELRLIAEGLREMAKEWRIPVVLMAQMNPVSAERKNKRPKLSEIRESNDMGNTADAAVLIYQERNENTDEIDSTELIVAKNRHGRRGTVVVGFEGALHNFAEPTTALAPPQSDELFG